MLKIDRATWILIALVGALLVALWALFNRPDNVPKWPETIQGVSFSPFRAGQSPQTTEYPSEKQISRDLQLLSDHVKSVRTYSVLETLGSVPRLARAAGLDVMVGVWITKDEARSRLEIETLRELRPELGSNVTSIIVGNEVLLRDELSEEELSAYVDEVREIVKPIPVTVAETWDVWAKNAGLAEHVDFVTAHVLPYWEGVPVEVAHEYVFERYDELKHRFRNKRVMLGEVGWPSEGRQRGGAIPSLENQAKFMRRFLALAHEENAYYNALEAFDQVWKTDEGAVGRYWGIWNDAREPKFPFNKPVTPVPDWPVIVGFSLAFTILILALLLRDSRGLVHGGRGFLVLVSYGISTAVVWLVYDYSNRYLSWEQVVVGFGLLAAAFCISIVLLAEAHEWAEAIWNKPSRQPLSQDAAQIRSRKVSIHVPIHKEPPDMVIQTLAALRDLDYDDYEVLVIDNNTPNRETWEPVQDWCRRQSGDRFKFHHVDPLPGFKAGALNFAMTETADDAELIAVIDSDYVVDPNWLGECTTLFDKDNVSIVQAPQDYRDAGGSLFKSMIYCEYAGFFGIGMVNRDARNAIIQHGTMTIVRRTALEDVNGWSEWCITEDAELGLRILARGDRAYYVPRSYGRGLMPDNFLDYKKQRFRWAYGSVLIMRHHFRYLFGMNRSELTSGQRYHFIAGWLPWMADGLSLMFNCVALSYAVLMVMFPGSFTPPEIMLSMLPIGFFVFKLVKMLVLYRWRMKATLAQSLAAGIAGLALSHTISRAMLEGLRTTTVGFFRTPKQARSHSLLRALNDAREEMLFGFALLFAAFAISLRDDAYLLDTKMWMALLIVQSIPYISAVLLSLISVFDHLSSRFVSRGDNTSLLNRLSNSMSGNTN